MKPSALSTTVGSLHGRHIHGRRVERLAAIIADLIPRQASVIDVGCGDGALAANIVQRRSDVSVQGVDVLARPRTQIAVTRFDGVTLPFPDRSADVVLFVDVLHHTLDPRILLTEARRVARRAVIVKDHCRDGVLARQTLQLMDWVGNEPHGVALPYNYWTEAEWRAALAELDLEVLHWRKDLGLYPPWMRWLFERSLHFVGVFRTA